MGAAKSTRRKGKQDTSDPSIVFRDRIEAERRRLQKASAVLLAMIYSVDRGLELEQAGDAAAVALDLIEQAVLALDAVELRRTDKLTQAG
jgi:hypothetical protein